LISVYPPNLSVQPPPLVNPQTLTITIVQNSTNNNLKVTDAQVVEGNAQAKNVEVSLKETQVGHYYNAFLTFPAGFELAQGHAIEFTAKTTSSKLPVIRVPISQAPRPPVPPPGPQAGAGPVSTPVAGAVPDGHKLPAQVPRATQ